MKMKKETKTNTKKTATTNFLAAAPQFLVEDVMATSIYYRDMLGFETGPIERHEESEPPYMALLRREGFYIQLRRAANTRRTSNRVYQGEACDVYFVVKDLDGLHRELASRNAKIISPPQAKFYPMREFEVEDCNGYILTFAQPNSQLTGQPNPHSS
jgi:uncharacterized glyoxalase superfamily protein PhnB